MTGLLEAGFVLARLPEVDPDDPMGWLRRAILEAMLLDGTEFLLDGETVGPAPQAWEPSVAWAIRELVDA